MTFTYTYKTSDGQRHEATIEATSRDEVFATLRTQGIRPMRVISPEPELPQPAGVRRRVVVVCAVVAACVAGAIAYWRGTQVGEEAVVVVTTPQGQITSSLATPLIRQAILGDRARLASCPTNLFAHPIERVLARYAEPGRSVPPHEMGDVSEEAVRLALREQIRVASNEFTEYVDLKRIVTGMKREFAKFLEDGGTISEYLSELANRQRMEVAYREKAEQKLAAQPAESQAEKQALYNFWLKANAQLQAMGIYPLPMPDSLRDYQLSLDLGE